MKKAAFAVVLGLFSYAVVDIMLWQRIFESHRLDVYAYLYHPGWWVMLASQIILGATLLAPNWRATVFYVGALFLLAMCGLEDVLYYWLDGRPIPYSLPWLERNPWIFLKPVTATNLLLSVSVWVGVCVAAFAYCLQREQAASVRYRALPEPISIDMHPDPSKGELSFRMDAEQEF